MRGVRRDGAGRKKPDHLKCELMTIRLPQWMISQLKKQRRNWVSIGEERFFKFAG